MRDRRAAQRYEIAVPIMVWNSHSSCFDGQTRDVSTSGVYILMNCALTLHEPFIFLMRFPGFLSDEESALLWGYCRAVRVEKKCVGGGQVTGIAAVVQEYTLPLRELISGRTPPRMAAFIPRESI